MDRPTPITLVQIDVPFGALVRFGLKVAVAAVPALLLLAVLASLASAVSAGVLEGVLRLSAGQP